MKKDGARSTAVQCSVTKECHRGGVMQQTQLLIVLEMVRACRPLWATTCGWFWDCPLQAAWWAHGTSRKHIQSSTWPSQKHRRKCSRKGEGRTWLDVLAVCVNIGAAGLSQQHVIAEVIHLHLLKVEHLKGMRQSINEKSKQHFAACT